MIFSFEHLILVGEGSNNFGSGGIFLHLGTWFPQVPGNRENQEFEKIASRSGKDLEFDQKIAKKQEKHLLGAINKLI